MLDLKRFFARLEACRDKNPHVHGLHPYPAKFIPHIPRALIQAYAPQASVVLDPMCGSGTALVEAVAAGHTAVGVDINPIATLVSRAKTTALTAHDAATLSALADRFDKLGRELTNTPTALERLAPVGPLPNFPNRSKWFALHVAQELLLAKNFIAALDSVAATELARCVFSATVVSVSNQESETRWCAKPSDIRSGETLRRLAARLSDALVRVREFSAGRAHRATVHLADARALPLRDNTVDFVVTSPPYANSHDYYLYNKLRLFWLDHNVAPVQASEIGSRNRHSDRREGFETYVDAMGGVMAEIARVLRPGGHVAIVVADAVVRGRLHDMASVYDLLAEDEGLASVDSFRFDHRRFNSSFRRTFGTTQPKRTHVLVYQRDPRRRLGQRAESASVTH
jgi:DNA modification methylase